ncbi:MAG: glycosyltransferase [Candidatus Ratteibacteria bacterium]
MKIFYASVIEKNAGWGSEYFLDKALRGLGHETYCVDYRKNRYRLYKRFINAPDCDAFLLQRGDYFPTPLIKSLRVPRLFLASELVSRNRDQDRLLKSRLFDHTFLHSKDCIHAVTSRNWVKPDKCSLLLSAFDDNFHRKNPEIVRDIDLLFVGRMSNRRRIILQKIAPRFNCLVTKAFGKEMVRLFNRAKIVLNIHNEDFLDTETRVFETLGCGSFLLTEQLSSENPFSEHELVQFKNTEDLMRKIRYFLDHQEEREAIAERGHSAALKNHTYTHRARQIAEVMSSFLKPVPENSRGTIRRGLDLRMYALAEPFMPIKYYVLKKIIPRCRKAYCLLGSKKKNENRVPGFRVRNRTGN